MTPTSGDARPGDLSFTMGSQQLQGKQSHIQINPVENPRGQSQGRGAEAGLGVQGSGVCLQTRKQSSSVRMGTEISSGGGGLRA